MLNFEFKNLSFAVDFDKNSSDLFYQVSSLSYNYFNTLQLIVKYQILYFSSQ